MVASAIVLSTAHRHLGLADHDPSGCDECHGIALLARLLLEQAEAVDMEPSYVLVTLARLRDLVGAPGA